MFHHRSTEFDPRLSAIAGHLRAIEKELGGIGRNASRNASASASTAGNQITEAIWPILNDIVVAFRSWPARTAAVERAGVVGLKFDRLVEIGDGAVGLARHAERDAIHLCLALSRITGSRRMRVGPVMTLKEPQ